MWFHPAHRVATAQYLSPRVRDAAGGVSDLPVSTLLSLSCPVLPQPCTLWPFPPHPYARGQGLDLLLIMLLLPAEPRGPYRTRRAPTPAWSSPGACAPPPTLPSLFISAQFLLDGKVLSLTDFQVSVVGSDGSGTARIDLGGRWLRETGFQGKGLPGELESRSRVSASLGRAEVLPWL